MILITGTTGFVGSALGARFLREGRQVLAISRNDVLGDRSWSAIKQAAEGMGFSVANLRPNLKVIAFEDLEADVDHVSEVWHCAAEMTYNYDKILEAMHTNVGLTAHLYEKVAAEAAGCARFYYVSTAYTSPMQDEKIEEKLHSTSDFLNSYQTSKWSAEQTLANMQKTHGLPITVFRPSIIVGDSKSGWSAGKAFGFYMFLNAFKTAKHMGLRSLQFDVTANAGPCLVHIDSLADAALSLSKINQNQRAFEIVHCTGKTALNNNEILTIMSAVSGLDYINKSPRDLFERRVASLVEKNKLFAEHDWSFHTTRMDSLIGTQWRRDIDIEEIVTLSRHYLHNVPTRNYEAAARTITH